MMALYAVVTELGEIIAVSVEGQEPSLGGAGHNVSLTSTDNILTHMVLHINFVINAIVYKYKNN